MSKYPITLKEQIYNQFLHKRSAISLSNEFNIPRCTIYRWIKENKQPTITVKDSTKQIKLLLRKIDRLQEIIEVIAESGCAISAPLKERLYALEVLYGKHNVHILCEALNVDRGTFYNHLFRNKKDNTWYSKQREILRVAIQKVYDDNRQVFGAGKITSILKEQGFKTSQETVRRLMSDMGLTSIRQRAKAMYEKERREYCKNRVNQQFNATVPNQIWVSDVTCYSFQNKTYCICVILDLFSRMIVSYKVSQRNSTQLVKSTFKSAYENRNPPTGLVFHTDRGANYKSHTFTSYLKSLGVIQSFSRAHIPYDNSVVESFFAALKREELYRRNYRSEKELRTAITDYMGFYNTKRPHSRNNYKTPAAKETEFCMKNTDNVSIQKVQK